MACFLVPAAEAVITTAVKKINEKHKDSDCRKNGVFLKRLNWLETMLWGGSALLAFEHVWHGEVIPHFPFLTNAANPADAAEMIREMTTVGVGMALIVTAVWAGMAVAADMIQKRPQTDAAGGGNK